LEEFFPVGYFNRLTVNLTSGIELEGEEDGEEYKWEDSPKRG